MAMRCPYLNWVNKDHAEELTEESHEISLAQNFKGLAAGLQSFQAYCI